MGLVTISIHAERLEISNTPRAKQVSLKSCLLTLQLLAGLNTQFQKQKKVLNSCLLKELKPLGDESRNILATKTALNFSGPHYQSKRAC